MVKFYFEKGCIAASKKYEGSFWLGKLNV